MSIGLYYTPEDLQYGWGDLGHECAKPWESPPPMSRCYRLHSGPIEDTCVTQYRRSQCGRPRYVLQGTDCLTGQNIGSCRPASNVSFLSLQKIFTSGTTHGAAFCFDKATASQSISTTRQGSEQICITSMVSLQSHFGEGFISHLILIEAHRHGWYCRHRRGQHLLRGHHSGLRKRESTQDRRKPHHSLSEPTGQRNTCECERGWSDCVCTPPRTLLCMHDKLAKRSEQ